MTGGDAPARADVVSTSRVEAFSDGVIAIAATLLVIELHPPEPGADLWHALAEELPSIAAFVVSFLTILIFWVNHHALFAATRRVDRRLLFLNGLLLLGISFISFPTAALGRALQGDADARPAAVFYTAVLLTTSLVFSGLWLYLRSHTHLLETDRRGSARYAVRRGLLGTGLYAGALVVALVNAGACLVLVGLVALYFAFPARSRR